MVRTLEFPFDEVEGRSPRRRPKVWCRGSWENLGIRDRDVSLKCAERSDEINRAWRQQTEEDLHHGRVIGVVARLCGGRTKTPVGLVTDWWGKQGFGHAGSFFVGLDCGDEGGDET